MTGEAADAKSAEPVLYSDNPDVEALGRLVFSEDFFRNFTDVQTRPQQKEFTQALHQLEKDADIAVHRMIPLRTAEISQLDPEHVKAVKNRMEERNQAERKRTAVPDFSDLGETPESADALVAVWREATEQSKGEILGNLPALTEQEKQRLRSEDNGEYNRAIEEAAAALVAARTDSEKQLESLREEFTSVKDSPELAAALAVWGRSPDAANDFGPDGTGYNAGVIHYFAYRANAEKNGRFPEWQKPTIEQLISYTAGLKQLVDMPDASLNPEVRNSRALTDRVGNMRLVMLSRRRNQIVTFSRRDNPGFRIITVMPMQSEADFQKDVDREMQGKSSRRLNKLEDGIQEITIPEAMLALESALSKQ